MKNEEINPLSMIRLGLTPRALEVAFAHGGVAFLSKVTGFDRQQIMALADRWGITRETAREAA